MKYYIELGADADKLVIGIPTYGRSYTLIDGNFTDFGSSADGPGEQGKYTREKGFMAFYEVRWRGRNRIKGTAILTSIHMDELMVLVSL